MCDPHAMTGRYQLDCLGVLLLLTILFHLTECRAKSHGFRNEDDNDEEETYGRQTLTILSNRSGHTEYVVFRHRQLLSESSQKGKSIFAENRNSSRRKVGFREANQDTREESFERDFPEVPKDELFDKLIDPTSNGKSNNDENPKESKESVKTERSEGIVGGLNKRDLYRAKGNEIKTNSHFEGNGEDIFFSRRKRDLSDDSEESSDAEEAEDENYFRSKRDASKTKEAKRTEVKNDEKREVPKSREEKEKLNSSRVQKSASQETEVDSGEESPLESEDLEEKSYDDTELQDTANKEAMLEDYGETKDGEDPSELESMSAIREQELVEEKQVRDTRVKRDQSQRPGESEIIEKENGLKGEMRNEMKEEESKRQVESLQQEKSMNNQTAGKESLKESALNNDKPKPQTIDVRLKDENRKISIEKLEPETNERSNEAPVSNIGKLSDAKNVEKAKEEELVADYGKRVEEEIQRKIDSIKEEIKREIEEKERVKQIEENNARFDEIQSREDEDDRQSLDTENQVESQTQHRQNFFKRSTKTDDENSKKRSPMNIEAELNNEKSRSKRESIRKGSELRRADEFSDQISNESPMKKREYVRQVFLVKDDKKRRKRKSRNDASISEKTKIKIQDKVDSDLTVDPKFRREIGRKEDSESGVSENVTGNRGKFVAFEGRDASRYRPQDIDDEENDEGNEYDDDGFDDRTSNLKETKSRFREADSYESDDDSTAEKPVSSSPTAENTRNERVNLEAERNSLTDGKSDSLDEYKEAFGGLQGEPGGALARFKRIKRVLRISPGRNHDGSPTGENAK